MGPAAGVLGAIGFVINLIAPDLILPKVPLFVKMTIAIAAGVAGLVVWAGIAWTALLRRWPRPWLPRPPWRVGEWIGRRPALSILLAPVEITNGLVVVEGAKASLTLHRDLSRTTRIARILFAGSRLDLSQKRGDRTLRWTFTPEEAGGFLGEPIAPGSRDNVLIVFRGTGFPMRQADLVDLTRPFELALSGVTAVVGEHHPLEGVVPAARWSWPGLPAGQPISFPPGRSALNQPISRL